MTEDHNGLLISQEIADQYGSNQQNHLGRSYTTPSSSPTQISSLRKPDALENINRMSYEESQFNNVNLYILVTYRLFVFLLLIVFFYIIMNYCEITNLKVSLFILMR